MQLGSEVAGQQAVLVDTVKEMRIETSRASLSLARGYPKVKDSLEQEVRDSRLRSEALNRVLLSGGVFNGIYISAVKDGGLQGRLQKVRQLQNEYYDFLEDTFTRRFVSGDGNEPTDDFSIIGALQDRQLNAALDGVEDRLREVITRKHAIFRGVQWVLMASILLCAIGASWMMWKFVRKLEDQNCRISESENRSRLLIENARDMIFLVDVVSQRIVDANAEACERLGYGKDELIGLLLHQIEPERELGVFGTNRFSGFYRRSFRVDTGFLTKLGESFPVEVNLGYVNVKNRVHWLGIIRDISERKRMEADLIEAKHQAEAANRIKGEFLGKISHEIRTPINGVMGVLQLLENTPLSPEQSEFVEMGLQSSSVLTNLIENILELSGLESGTLEIWSKPFFLMETVAAVGVSYAEKVANKGLRYEVDFDESIPDELIGDENRVREILENLVENAVKFTEHGGVDLIVKRLPRAPGGARKAIWVRFEVKDSGPGIDDDKMESIFEPFQQGDNSGTRRFEGAGLGLSVVKRLVEKLNGYLYFDVKEGVGSNFIVELPFTCGKERRSGSVAFPRGGSSREAPGLYSLQKPPINGDLSMNLVEILGKLGMAQGIRGIDFNQLEEEKLKSDSVETPLEKIRNKG